MSDYDDDMREVSVKHRMPKAEWKQIAYLFDGVPHVTTDKDMTFTFDSEDEAFDAYYLASRQVGGAYLYCPASEN